MTYPDPGQVVRFSDEYLEKVPKKYRLDKAARYVVTSTEPDFRLVRIRQIERPAIDLHYGPEEAYDVSCVTVVEEDKPMKQGDIENQKRSER